MSILVDCPCGKKLRIGEEYAGKQGQCPACYRVFDIPAVDGSPVLATLPAPESTNQLLTVKPVPTEVSGAGSPEGKAVHEALSVTPLRLEEIAPPDFDEPAEFRAPQYKLYSPGHVLLATFLSNVLGGSILIALNYRALGHTKAAWRIVIFGAVTLLVLVVVLILLPDKASTVLGVISWVLSMGVMYQFAKTFQGEALEKHFRRGGQKASAARAAGIGLLCGIGTAVAGAVGMVFAYDALSGFGLGQKVVFGTQEEVYYAGGATEAEARKLGQALQQNRFFDGQGEKTVQISKSRDRFIISFVLVEGFWDKPNVRQLFRELGQQLSQKHFGGKPLEIRLCNEWMTTKKTIYIANAHNEIDDERPELFKK